MTFKCTFISILYFSAHFIWLKTFFMWIQNRKKSNLTAALQCLRPGYSLFTLIKPRIPLIEKVSYKKSEQTIVRYRRADTKWSHGWVVFLARGEVRLVLHHALSHILDRLWSHFMILRATSVRSCRLIGLSLWPAGGKRTQLSFLARCMHAHVNARICTLPYRHESICTCICSCVCLWGGG